MLLAAGWDEILALAQRLQPECQDAGGSSQYNHRGKLKSRFLNLP